MANILKSLVLASLLVFGLTGESVAETQWRTISITDRGFFVDMPGAPKHSSNKGKTSSGGEYTSDVYVVEAGNEAFVVTTTVYPADVDTSNPRRNLQSGLDNTRKGMDDKALSGEKWATTQGLPSVEAAGVRGGFAIRILSLMDGKRIIVLTYAGPPGSANSGNANRFVESFRIAR